MDVDPDTEALEKTVAETQQFNVKLKVDAQNLYGLSFKFTWDTTASLVSTPTFTAPWAGKCARFPPRRGLRYRCNLEYPTPEYDATAARSPP